MDWAGRPNEPMVLHVRGMRPGQRVVDDAGRPVEFSRAGDDGVIAAKVALTHARAVRKWAVEER